jgi:glutamyl-tRNA synthetase
MTVKTRVAPSPTGDPHVGTAYVALMNYLFAKQHGGEFILRIEDTDRARSTLESEQVILKALNWMGLSWSEGPDVGGPNGPYRQSERGDIYAKYADQLLTEGNAFRCFCTSERLDALRARQSSEGQPPRYDGRCMHVPEAEAEARVAAGESHVLRMKIPTEGVCVFNDMARGDIEIPWDSVDMQVLMKSDGMPTYHLANVVDDHLMGITHVLRGEEWIPSAPKHQLLYRYFGWEMPRLFHLPLLRNPDRSKLSKRKNPTSVLFYERMGYLPEALTNFLGLSAVSQAEGDELMDFATLQSRFDVSNISLGGPIFDVSKLDWLNGRWLREVLSPEGFRAAIGAWMTPAYLDQVADMAQSRITRLSDLGPATSFLFAGRLEPTVERLLDGKLDQPTLNRALNLASIAFEREANWTQEAIESALRVVAEITGAKFKDLVRHMFIVMTGKPQSLPLFRSMELMGRDIARERMRESIAVLGGASSKEVKAWTADLDKHLKAKAEAAEAAAAEPATEA